MRIKSVAILLITLLLAASIMAGCSLRTSVIYTTVPEADETATTGSATNWDDVPPAYPDVPQITAKELKQLMDDNVPLIVIDVRDEASYGYSHIPGAVNFAYNPAADPMIMTMMLWTIPGGKKVVFYCNCPDDNTSGRFAQQLIDEGIYKDVVDLHHGMQAWWDEGYPVVTGMTVDEFVTTTMTPGK